MTVIWSKLKKNLIDSLNVAIDKTEELTSVGRIKIEMLQLEHRLDEKFVELGRLIYQKLSKDVKRLNVTEEISGFRSQIEELQTKIDLKEQELGRIKKDDGIDFD